MQKLQAFWNANKVVIFGVISAAILAVQQLTSSYATDYKVLGLAGFIAVLSFLSKNLRGQWASILGSLLPALGIVLSNLENHTPISWVEFFGAAALAFGGVVAPPAKSISYEVSPVVTEAKKEAAAIDSKSAPPKNPPVSSN